MMSLRLQLLLVGLLLLACLGARWWWLERKIKRQKEGAAPAPTDALQQRVEPAMSVLSEMPVVPEMEQAPAPLAESPEFANLSLAVNVRPATLHPQIDCIALLEMDAPSKGEMALNLMPSTRRIGSKTWQVEGFNVSAQAWEGVGAGQAYSRFQAGIQLVNRNGALNDVEFSEFVAKASQLAEGLGASADFPDMMREVARAKELEQFTQAHDICLSLHLQAKRAVWSLPYVQQQVKQAGFVAGVLPGRWVLGSSEHELIALLVDSQAAMADDANAVPIHKLTLRLDVPKVARGDSTIGKPFDAMCDAAVRLCASMEAVMLDEQGLSVDLKALQRTAQELEEVYDRLDAVGLSAGSSLAKRLFS